MQSSQEAVKGSKVAVATTVDRELPRGRRTSACVFCGAVGIGYNSGRGISNNCSIGWAGPTDVTVGAEPYGGHMVVAFTCQVLNPGSIGTSVSLHYSDAAISQWATSQSDLAGAIGITIQ
jgi:hypothetical protein